MTVAMAAVFLKERVRRYRWWAVIVGFAGIVVMLAPHFDPKHYATAAASAATRSPARCATPAR
jgi:drug/metabolite transporter (DMT)-like permease